MNSRNALLLSVITQKELENKDYNNLYDDEAEQNINYSEQESSGEPTPKDTFRNIIRFMNKKPNKKKGETSAKNKKKVIESLITFFNLNYPPEEDNIII